MDLYQYFDRIAVIHLPERVDRFKALGKELSNIGIDINSKKVVIPDAPRVSDACGFASKGVAGNFLSHLSILKTAQRDNLEQVLVLEDDAIFRHSLRRRGAQESLTAALSSQAWDMWFGGHSLTQGLVGHPPGLALYSGGFIWAHCYAVHRRGISQVIDYLEESLANPVGHSRGGRLYIDAAYTTFRALYPDSITLVSNPAISAQRGSRSSLAGGSWYDKVPAAQPVLSVARALRDEFWRAAG